MSRLLVLVLVVLAGCGGTPAPERAAHAPSPEGLDAELAKQRAAAGAPGVVAALAVDGQVVWAGAAGRAGPGRAMTPATPMAFGSITKTVTAAVALRLAEQGRLDLDAPVSRLVPEWREAGDTTLRRLLSHTSGVADPGQDFYVDTTRHPAHVYRPADWIAALPARFAGASTTTPSYANANFILAGLAIKRAAGRDWLPLLRSVAPGLALQPDERVASRPAVGYWQPRLKERTFPTGGGGMVPSTGMATTAWTAGGLAGPAPALARFGDRLLGGRLLSADSLKEMTAFNSGTAMWAAYGLGLGRQYVGGHEVWGHGGDIPGFHAELWHLPDRDLTLAVAWNDDRVDDDGIVRGLLRVALGEQ
jgi:D-alanyl-D-alanine carboxypeptidase